MDPTSVDFGTRSYGSLNLLTFTLSNTGGADAVFQDYAFAPNSPFQFRSAPGSSAAAPFPGMGGDCPTDKLSPGQSCHFVVTYNPTLSVGAIGSGSVSPPDQQTLVIHYWTYAPLKTGLELAIPLSGQSNGDALLAFSQDGVTPISQTIDLGTVAVGYPIQVPLQLLYWGYLPATDVTFVTPSDGFSWQSVNCPTTQITANCAVTIGYQATQVGHVQSQPIKVWYNNGSSPASATVQISFDVSPEVIPAKLAFSQGSVDFGTEVVGGQVSRTLNVTRTGTLPATGATLQITPSSESANFSANLNDCQGTVPSACQPQVTFAPRTAGPHNATLILNYYNGQASDQIQIPLAGLAQTTPQLVIASGNGLFPQQVFGTTFDETFVITNSAPVGSWPASGIVPLVSGAGFSLVSNTCLPTLMGGGNCSVTVEFAPQLGQPFNGQIVNSQFTGSLVIGYQNGMGPQQIQSNLSGSGTTLGHWDISQTSLDFGNVLVGNSSTISVPANYVGLNTGTIEAIRGASAPYSVSIQSALAYPALQGAGSIAITFTPTVQQIYPPTVIEIDYNDGDPSSAPITVAFQVSGTGGSPAHLSFVGPLNNPLFLGTISQGQTAKQQFMLKNNGGVMATAIAFAGLSAPFSVQPTANACGTSLAAGQTCVVEIDFTPASVGNFSANLNIQYKNGVSTNSLALSVQGTGLPNAVLQFTQATYDFGSVLVGSSSTAVLYVSYFGARPAIGLSTGGITSSTQPYALTSSPIPKGVTLPPCQSPVTGNCILLVNFSPTTPGSFSTALTLNYNDSTYGPGTPTIVAVKGTALRPALLQAAPVSIDFGAVSAGNTTTMTLTLTNSGNWPATIGAAGAIAAPFSLRAGGGCFGHTVAAGAQCMETVQFLPLSAASFSQPLVIPYQDGISSTSLTVPIQGIGSSVAVLAFPTSSLSFGTRVDGSHNLLTVPIYAYGTDLAVIQPGSPQATPPFYVASSTCGSAIQPIPVNASQSVCTIQVGFAPLVAGPISGSLQIVFQSGSSSTNSLAVLNLTGSAQAAGSLSVLSPSANPYDFGTQPSNLPQQQTFTIINSAGSAASPVSALQFNVSAMPFSITSGSCLGTSSLAPGQSCTVTVNFVANSQYTGNLSANLLVSYFDGAQTQVLSEGLQGTGTNMPLLRFAAASFNAGNALIGGTPVTFSVALDYYGGAPAQISAISAIGPDFALAPGNTCGAVGSSVSGTCQVHLTFSPQAAGNRATNLVLTYLDAQNGVHTTAPLALSGTGQSPAQLTFSAASIGFGNVAVGSQVSHIITVHYTGNVSANLGSAPALSAPFAYTGGNFPGQGGNCGLMIAADCQLALAFNPTNAGTFSATLALNYQSGIASATASLGLNGTGLPIAALTVSLSPFADTLVGQSSQAVLQIQNNGGHTASNLSLSATLPFAPAALNATTLSSGASTSVFIGFTPTAPGNVSQTIMLTFDNGMANVSVPIPVSANGIIPMRLSANGNHTCVVTRFGQLKCWGRNDYGQLGLGDTVNRGDNPGEMGASLPAVNVVGSASDYTTDVCVGFNHSCALLNSGNMKCWGRNDDGELGQGDTFSRGGANSDMGDNLLAIDLGTGHHATQIACGYSHSCAVLENGAVKCWGQNTRGQLGLGDSVDRGSLPGQMGDVLPSVDLSWLDSKGVVQPGTATKLSLGTAHTCAVLQNSQVKCFGDNFYGELGQGDSQPRGTGAGQMGIHLPFINLGTNHSALTVAAGGGFTCILRNDGSVVCVGLNNDGSTVANNVGALGYGYCQSVNGGLAAGPCTSPNYPYVLPGYGEIAGQTGDSWMSVNVGTGRTVLQLAAGAEHVCAVLDNLSLKCWGDNTFGQLGQGDTNRRGVTFGDMGDNLAIVDLGSFGNPIQIAGSSNHSCALSDRGLVKCWGDGSAGDLGQGDTQNRGDQPGELGDTLAPVSF